MRVPASPMSLGLGLQVEETRAESVSEFTRRVKLHLETGIRPAWIRGEISNLRAQASGHVYFSLKDAGAQLSAVLFRGDGMRQTVKLRDGLQVVVYGEISVYEARGQYQLIVRIVVDDGVGRLQREFEALKARLAAEGLFAAERKKPVPAMPLTVGFITSPTGAAVQDFVRIIMRRKWCGRVAVLPAKVQGEGAATEMVGMLRLAQRLQIFDLLVIGRGGGSLEDLWAFNEEPLVRAVAECAVPIISAVGHEIDFTLCDFAADVRAETPSGGTDHESLLELQRAGRAVGGGDDRAGRCTDAAGAGAPRSRAIAAAAAHAGRADRAGISSPRRSRKSHGRGGAERRAFAAPRTGRASLLPRPALTRTARAGRIAPAAFVMEAPAGRESALGAEPGFRDPEGRRRQGGHAQGADEIAAAIDGRVRRRHDAGAGGVGRARCPH
jgi:hypothetical protein